MAQQHLKLLEDLWDEELAATLDGPELLRYRSNLLGSDLRITNFGGGNTSSKVQMIDPLDQQTKSVLWVKGSGGDLGGIRRSGFATLYMDKLLALENAYRGVELEDEMVAMYPLCTFGNNPVVASIDTSLHALLPFPHVDHLHPDWAIAMAASANGRIKMEEFNREFGRTLAWLPWQRPGFELGIMLREIVKETPGCDGVVLGGHGLFTWGDTQRESYLNTITIIDQLGQFIERHAAKLVYNAFNGAKVEAREDREAIARAILPCLRGNISRRQRSIGSFTDTQRVLDFVNSEDAEALAHLGTSCPDHFIRTKIRPMFLDWNVAGDPLALKQLIPAALEHYRAEYAAYYNQYALPDSPALRDASPTVVLIPGIGMFSFGKSKTEARITGELYINAIGVMKGAGALGEDKPCLDIPQAGPAAAADLFKTHRNYVALPASEAFRIEYWALEDAKIRRRPPEKELSRRIVMVVGGGSGIGREAALLAAERGAHVSVADRDAEGAEAVADEIAALYGKETAVWSSIDVLDRKAIRTALDATVTHFGGIDILVNTAAISTSAPDGVIDEAFLAHTLEANVTAHRLLTNEARDIFLDQDLDASIVLTGSEASVAIGCGNEESEGSKAALTRLIRELDLSMPPLVRVNGVSTAIDLTTLARDRVLASLHQPIDLRDCAEAVLFLASPAARCITGHLIPVDEDEARGARLSDGPSKLQAV